MNALSQQFLNFVINRPSSLRSSDPAICPYCRNYNLRSYGESTTLLGGGDGTPDGDPNHRQKHLLCRNCNIEFVCHRKYANVWYTTTQELFVLLGMPSCFEKFIYTHTCGGRVIKRHKVDGNFPTNTYYALSYNSDGTKNFTTVFACESCNAELESDFEYWDGYS